MKFLNNKNFVRKILIVLVTIIMVSFTVPIHSQASDDLGGKLFNPVAEFLAFLADIPIGFLQHSMLGVTNVVDSVTLDYDDDKINMVGDGVWSPEKSASIKKELGYGNTKGDDGILSDDAFLSWRDNEIDIPNILYCPEYIFANRIAALDVDFINPGTYYGGQITQGETTTIKEKLKDENGNDVLDENGNIVYIEKTVNVGDQIESQASKLTKIVSSWYKAIRNIAIVGLLSILVYIGIRILIGSTAQDKAKYKERLKDWFIGLCLVFAMHYIMAGVMMITDVVTQNIGQQLDDNMIQVTIQDYKDDGDITFNTNYMGYIRLLVQSKNPGDAFAYLIMYIALVIFTVMFTIIYLKRVLYMAFFTMIAPLVAMTYPLDKLADGHAQGFNMWFREYMLNAIIQPLHLVLYMIIMGSVLEMAVENPIYGIVAIGFLIPAEKFIKKMFRFDKGETTSALGAVAGGALAMKGVQAVGGMAKRIGGGKESQEKVRTKDTPQIESSNRKRNKDVEDPETVLFNENPNNPVLPEGRDDIKDTNRLSSNINNAWGQGSSNAGWQDGGEITFANNNYEPIGEGFDNFVPNSASGTSSNQTPRDSTIRQTSAVPERSGQAVPQQPERIVATPTGAAARPGRFKTLKGRIGRVGGALYSSADRKLSRVPDRLKGKAIKGVKSLPRTVAKLGGAAVGAAALGSIAAGAALTTGDLGKGASMVGAGAWLGATIGGSVGGRAGDSFVSSQSGISATISDAWKTDEEKAKAKQAKKAKYDREWRLKEENYKYLKKKGKTDKEAKEYLNDSKTQAFLNAGITDINTIYNARKLMDNSNGRVKLEGAVARAELAKRVSKNFGETEKKAFMDNMKKKNSRFTDNDVKQLVSDIETINDTDS
ncbi:MAG: FUSC family protein [Clostridia bacterium]|nr:FUSC family protein [Clostridia bacterium]